MADTPSFQVPSQMRTLAETNVAQARKAFDGFMNIMKRGAETVRGPTDLSPASVQDMYARGLDYTEQNVHAAFDHAKKLARAGTPMAAMQLQAEYVRERCAAMQAQAKEFLGMAQSVVQQGADNAREMTQQGEDAARQVAQETQDAVDHATC